MPATSNRFGDDYVHLFTLVTSRPLGKRFSLGLEYDGTYERAFADGELDSQWMRRISLGYNVSNESSFQPRTARYQRPWRLCAVLPGRQQPRGRVSPAIPGGRRAVRQLRKPGFGRNAQPFHREVRPSRRRRRGHVAATSRPSARRRPESQACSGAKPLTREFITSKYLQVIQRNHWNPIVDDPL